ncbi:MAG: hypothetical protein KF836_06205 [Fimbriimonadaceae bacterium]|nr:hypothetical protein [Fimbriimonadaceae bacterium]
MLKRQSNYKEMMLLSNAILLGLMIYVPSAQYATNDLQGTFVNGSTIDLKGLKEKISKQIVIEGKKSIRIKNGTLVIGKDIGSSHTLLGFSKCEDILFENVTLEVNGNKGALAFAQCKNVRFINSRIIGKAVVMLRFAGGSGLEVRNSIFSGQDGSEIAVEVLPGHPYSFKDTATNRRIQWNPNARWNGGTNLSAAIGPLGFKNSFRGNGQDRISIRLGTYPNGPIWKTDGQRPLSDNLVEITGKKSANIISETQNEFVLKAEGVFERGKEYFWWTYNPQYNVKNVQIVGNQFRDFKVAGFSGYFVDQFALKDNVFSGIREDYGLGVEMGSNGQIVNNDGYFGSGYDPRVRIGLIGRMVNIDIVKNKVPIHYNSMGQRASAITSDSRIQFVGTQSPWMSNEERRALERGN